MRRDADQSPRRGARVPSCLVELSARDGGIDRERVDGRHRLRVVQLVDERLAAAAPLERVAESPWRTRRGGARRSRASVGRIAEPVGNLARLRGIVCRLVVVGVTPGDQRLRPRGGVRAALQRALDPAFHEARWWRHAPHAAPGLSSGTRAPRRDRRVLDLRGRARSPPPLRPRRPCRRKRARSRGRSLPRARGASPSPPRARPHARAARPPLSSRTCRQRAARPDEASAPRSPRKRSYLSGSSGQARSASSGRTASA